MKKGIISDIWCFPYGREEEWCICKLLFLARIERWMDYFLVSPRCSHICSPCGLIAGIIILFSNILTCRIALNPEWVISSFSSVGEPYLWSMYPDWRQRSDNLEVMLFTAQEWSANRVAYLQVLIPCYQIEFKPQVGNFFAFEVREQYDRSMWTDWC